VSSSLVKYRLPTGEFWTERLTTYYYVLVRYMAT
jgi:hypothetical protein